MGSFHLSPSCAPVSVAEYASVTPNIPRYPWKCLKKLCQGSEYAWSSYMLHGVLKISGVLYLPECVQIANVTVTQSSEYDWIWLNMSR